MEEYGTSLMQFYLIQFHGRWPRPPETAQNTCTDALTPNQNRNNTSTYLDPPRGAKWMGVGVPFFATP